MIAAWPVLLKVLFGVTFVAAYYRYGKRWLFAGAQWLAQRVHTRGHRDRNEIAGVLELAAAATSHVAAVALLVGLTGLSLSGIHLGPAPVALVALGVLIGIGEMALASFLCRLIVEAALLRDRLAVRALPGRSPGGGAPSSVKGWLAISRGGWMRHHFTTLEVAPIPVAVLVIGVQVGSEETIFRGVFLQLFRPSGFLVAFTVSLLLFVAMQVFFMANWRAAMFPVVGALVMGVVHGLLAWQVPYLLPLVVAHIVFFLFAVI